MHGPQQQQEPELRDILSHLRTLVMEMHTAVSRLSDAVDAGDLVIPPDISPPPESMEGP